jgi:hypothetical protein
MSSLDDHDIPTYNIRKLLVILDFIGNVPPNRKICVKSKIYIDPAKLLTQPYRWINGEDASKTCDYIDLAVQNLQDALKEYRAPDNKIRLALIDKSKIFRQGLINLIDTYTDNPDAKATLRAALTVLDLRIPENRSSATDRSFTTDRTGGSDRAGADRQREESPPPLVPFGVQGTIFDD